MALLALAAAAPLHAQAARSHAPAVDPEALRAHVAFLASDSLRGRATPGPGLEAAAAYLADAFQAAGLRPAGDAGGYVQRFPLTTFRTGEGTRLSVRTAAGTQVWEYGRDFVVLQSDSATAGGEAVFVGTLDGVASGLPSSVRGRVAVISVPGVPGAAALGAGRLAQRAGAAGVVLVLDPGVNEAAIRAYARMLEEGTGAGQPLPVFALSHAAGRELLAAGGADPGALRAPCAECAARGVPLAGVALELAHDARPVEHQVPNVVAVLPGSDPVLRESYVVVSAHFDHVGVGVPDADGDSIYNGADDNASGTAAMLEVARALAALPEAPARSVLFVGFSGEEKGLMGSRWMMAHPPVARERMVGVVNLDMVGRNAPDTVVAVGREYSTLGALAVATAEDHPELGLRVAPDPAPQQRHFFRSDHYAFAERGIPALFLTSRPHEDYHRPSDEVEKLDTDKAARVAGLVFHLVRAVAAASEAPAWTEEGRQALRAAEVL